MIKLGWYIITKSFKGGEDKYRLKVTKKIKEKFNDNYDELLEYIGENTDGGSSYGYNINMEYRKNKVPYEKPIYFKEVERIELIVGNKK